MYMILLGLEPPLCFPPAHTLEALWTPALVCIVRIVPYLLASLALTAFSSYQNHPLEALLSYAPSATCWASADTVFATFCALPLTTD